MTLFLSARFVWGKPKAVSIRVENTGNQPVDGELRVVLSTDKEADPQDPIVVVRTLKLLPGGAQRRREMDLVLPAYLRWRDGDYYLVAQLGESRSAAPVHVESRDIEEEYVPRNYDLVGAQCSPAAMTPEWRRETLIRHCRWDVSWNSFEPEQGQWNQELRGGDH